MRKTMVFGAFLVVIAFLLLAASDMRDFGEPVNTEMDDYFIENAQEETSSNNVVTAVVFDYRGYDTLGEATVLFAAVSGIAVALRTMKNKTGRKKKWQ